MKKLIPCILAALALTASATGALAQDSDQVQRLEIQVQRLRAEVARLNAELMELRERVKMIEKSLGEEPLEPPAEDHPGSSVRPPAAAPDTPAARPPLFFGGSAAGSYALDKEHFEKAILDYALSQAGEGLGQMPEEQRAAAMAQLRQMAKLQAGMMNLNLELNRDGTFKVTGLIGGENLDAGGTWTQDGSAVTFTTTRENGQPKDDPEVQTATYGDGVLVLKPGEEIPIELHLRKK